MKHAQISVQERTILGNKAKNLRKTGEVLAVIYGKKQEAINIQLPFTEFLKLYRQVGSTNVVDVAVNDKKSIPCIIHDLEIHPVTGKLLHVDFLAVNLKEKVTATVPVEYVGEAEGVKTLGAILMTNIEELEVEALPDNIPSSIEVDVTSLKSFSDVIYIKDLPKSDKYVILEDGDATVAVLSTETAEVLEEPTVTEGVEGESAPASEEAAPTEAN